VFEGRISFAGVERLAAADEALLLRAMVQTLLDKSLCIAEDTSAGRQLIFPSQYRRERPIPAHPEIFVSYTFSGELATVYTTLVVRLWYSGVFGHKELWRNAAEFVAANDCVAGLLLERRGDGEGVVSVFFENGIPDSLRLIFIEFVHRHLHKYAQDVARDRRYICACGEPVTNLELVRKRLAAGKDFITCQNCDERVPLIDAIERRLSSDPVARKVLRMDAEAGRALGLQALEQILIGHLTAICGEAGLTFSHFPQAQDGVDGEVAWAAGRTARVHLWRGGAHLRLREKGLPHPQDAQAYKVELHRILDKRFSADEIKTLCFHVGLNHEELAAQTHSGQARDIIAYLERRQRLPELARYCRQHRPDIGVPDLPPALAGPAQLVFEIANANVLSAWGNLPDVYLVARDAEDVIRWMNLTQYLKTRKDKRSRYVVFDGEKLDAAALLRQA